LGHNAHAVADESLTGPHVGSAVDLHEAVEADAHAAKETARLVAPRGPAKRSAPRGQQDGGHRLAFVDGQFLPVE